MTGYRYCPICGYDIPPRANYCSKCGLQIRRKKEKKKEKRFEEPVIFFDDWTDFAPEEKEKWK